MKKILFLLSLVLTTSAAFAQTEGHISYKIDATTDNPDMQMAIGMLQGSTMDIYFKDKATRSEMKMGSMMTITTITNESSNEMLMLMSGMMGNNAIKSPLEQPEDVADSAVVADAEVTLIDETKEIEGYSCKKAIVTSEDGIESVFWYTDQIEVSTKGQRYFNTKIPGFPMQFEINNRGLKMTITVVEIDKKLDKKKSSSLFNMEIPQGYTEMSMDDLQKMGGMGM
jgi:GLPGLI family protein